MHSVEKKIYLGLLVCLLVSVVGTSFAYFVSSTTINGEGGRTNMTTADMVGVKFDAGDSAINLQNAMPGLGKEKGFAVMFTPTSNTKTVTYAIKLNITENAHISQLHVNRFFYKQTHAKSQREKKRSHCHFWA